MAGIGFELKKILNKNSLLSVVEAYGLAGIIGSGPWIVSILALLCIGMISLSLLTSPKVIIQFLVIVTYLMAGSLIVSGMFQLLLTRFVSDLIYAKQEQWIVSNLLGAMLVITIVGAIVAISIMLLSPNIDILTKIVICSAFVLLCNQWLTIIFLSGMKEYYQIFFSIMISYSLMVLLTYLLSPDSLLGLMIIFTICQAILTFSFLFSIIRSFPPKIIVSFEFLDPKKTFFSLLFCGLFYNLGVWLDKFVFWSRHETSHQVLDFFHASYVYDVPIFIAYLAIVPGMAVFMLKMETDFADKCLNFFAAVRNGATYRHIVLLKNDMIKACQTSIFYIFKVQGITCLLLLLFARDLLRLLGIDVSYLHLLYVDLVGVSLQVLVMAILNVMYYLDKRYEALFLTIFMVCSNFLLAHLSINLGPMFYGYGFAITMLLTTLIGMVLLDKQFASLEYSTFMLQKSKNL